MTRKVLLAVSVFSTLMVVYFGFGTEPDIKLWKWFGYEYGFNLAGNVYWKLLSVASWVLWILAKEVKDEGDNNSRINFDN